MVLISTWSTTICEHIITDSGNFHTEMNNAHDRLLCNKDLRSADEVWQKI